MKIPYVIDNQTCLLGEVLTGVLQEYAGRSLDVATAYFTVGGFDLIQGGLGNLSNFRLLLGAELIRGEQIGLRPVPDEVRGTIRRDLEDLPFGEATLRLVEDLITYLRKDSVQVRVHQEGFLHAKCWIFYSDRPGQHMLFDRFRPVVAIVGSSNFTRPGLTSNRELNLAHKVLLEPSEAEDAEASEAVGWLSDARPSERITVQNRQLLKSEVGSRAIIDLSAWFDRQWEDARNFKEDLIALLDESKFGRHEYTPYQVYMKALYEYFKGEVEEEGPSATRSVVELAEFQEDAVKKARKILARYDGVMIADSVGLGKTWIGKKLLEDFAYHMRQKAVVICPASLRPMWERELRDSTISASILSQEELGREEFDISRWADTDILLVDEAHNFRNKSSQRYAALESLIGANGGRGRDGMRKKLVLLTATPVNNDLFDLYNQISLITQGDRSYFSAVGIGDLYRYFLQARRDARTGLGVSALFNLLEEVVIRRTRPFIRKAYPEATIAGKKIHFPKRRLSTIRYDLESVYGGIYDEIVLGIENLKLAPYNLESYKKAGVEVDEFEAGREQALVGIFKSRYLKRFESSVEAFRISVRRALAFLKTFESYILKGRLLKSTDFRKALRYLAREDEEDDAMPTSLARDLDENEDARLTLGGLATINPANYDLARLHEALQNDIEALTDMWLRIKGIEPGRDAKLSELKDLLKGKLRGKKVLIFTYFKDTARYLYRHLGHPEKEEAKRFRAALGDIRIRRMDSDADAKTRMRTVQSFAPKANEKPEWAGTEHETDILISTDVLSEGQNLQDCGYLLNYDLHWNPTRMVQRAGRIDRIGTEFKTLWIYNMYPEEGLERLLGLVERLSRKIEDINRLGMLDASILGETVNPRNFNTLRRIRDEDGAVIEEEEQFSELASSEFLAQQLRDLLNAGGKEMLEKLPDGIHSGLIKPGAKGVFFYFQADSSDGEKLHFWRFVDWNDRPVIDNRFILANMIACERDTPRIVDPEMFRSVFDLQEKAIEDILRSFEQQEAAKVAPRSVDPIQQTLSTVLQGYLSHPDVDRKQAIEAVRFLNQPMLGVQVKSLRESYRSFQTPGKIQSLLNSVLELKARFGSDHTAHKSSGQQGVRQLRREDLRLICFDFVSA